MKQSIFIFLALLTACSSHTNDPFKTRKGNLFDAMMGLTEYQRTFLSKTQERTVHAEFEGILSAKITPWDGEVQEAYLKEMKSQFRLDDKEEMRLTAAQLSEGETYFIFILSAATREPNWNDFHKVNSMWAVTLESEDAKTQARPERIEAVTQNDERWLYFYPTMDTFNRTYRIRFDKKLFKNQKKLILTISGVRGALQAEFDNDRAMQ